MMAELGQCEDCLYWRQKDVDHYHGDCRRYPPTVKAGVASYHCVWPETRHNMDCGEFKDKGRT